MRGSFFRSWTRKGQRIAGSDAELAFTSYQRALRVVTFNRVEIATDGAVHPTQKPIKLMRWCISKAECKGTILDPFMGSGSTLRAAMDMQCPAIGIELEERYCEIAVRRLSQTVMALDVA
jgi:site-specific DNA-methyltransferase (adenine-specific)